MKFLFPILMMAALLLPMLAGCAGTREPSAVTTEKDTGKDKGETASGNVTEETVTETITEEPQTPAAPTVS